MPESLRHIPNQALEFSDGDILRLDYIKDDGSVGHRQGDSDQLVTVTPTHIIFDRLNGDGTRIAESERPIINNHLHPGIPLLGQFVAHRAIQFADDKQWSWYHTSLAKPELYNTFRESTLKPLGGHSLPLAFRKGKGPDGLFNVWQIGDSLVHGMLGVSTKASHLYHDLSDHALGMSAFSADSIGVMQDAWRYAIGLNSKACMSNIAHGLAIGLARSLDYYSFNNFFVKEYAARPEIEPMLTGLLYSSILTSEVRWSLIEIIEQHGFEVSIDGAVLNSEASANYYPAVIKLMMDSE